MKSTIVLFITSLMFGTTLHAKVKVGEQPEVVTISGDNGGKVVDGSAWSSASIKGKVHTLFYVDPDEKEANRSMEKSLKSAGFERSQFGSIAVINLGATWKPNWIIEKVLASRQKEFPHTVYVKDKEKTLVKAWGLNDDAYNVLLFSKEGKLLYRKAGTLSDKEIKDLIKLIKANL